MPSPFLHLILTLLLSTPSHATSLVVGPQPPSLYALTTSVTPSFSEFPTSAIPFSSLLSLATNPLLVSSPSLYSTPFFRQSFSFPPAINWTLEGITTYSDSQLDDPDIDGTVITLWTHPIDGAKISVIRNGTIDPDPISGELPKGLGYVDCKLAGEGIDAGGIVWWRGGLWVSDRRLPGLRWFDLNKISKPKTGYECEVPQRA